MGIMPRWFRRFLPFAHNFSTSCAVLWSLPVLLAAFLMVPGAQGQADPQSSSDPQTTAQPDAVPLSTPENVDREKNSPKYDVQHIGNRGVGKGMNIYSVEREHHWGEMLARNIELHTKFLNDPLITEYINNLGQKLVRNSDCVVPFSIKVIDSGDIRAFSLPGGFLYVDSGLILASDTEAELAGALAHEIAHVAARHGTRAATRRFVWDVVTPLTYLGGPVAIGVQNAGGVGVPLSMKKFSRDAEKEADLLGIEYEYAAGYDPEAFVTALEKLHVIEARMHSLKTKIPAYNFLTRMPLHSQIAKGFASYPMTEERIRRVQAEIANLLPGKTDYITDTSDFQNVKARLLQDQQPVLRRHRPGDTNAGPVLRRNRPD